MEKLTEIPKNASEVKLAIKLNNCASKTLDEIKQLHSEIITCARTTLDKAIRIGELLTQQKATLKHGQWLPWVEKNLPFADDTARRYMGVYSRRGEIPHCAEFGLTDAYRLLAAPKIPEETVKVSPMGDDPWFEAHKVLLLKDPHSKYIPPAGAAMIGRSEMGGDYGGWVVVIYPSYLDGWFHVTSLAPSNAGCLAFTKKPVAKDRIAGTLAHFCVPAETLTWETHSNVEPGDSWNQLAYTSLEDSWSGR